MPEFFRLSKVYIYMVKYIMNFLLWKLDARLWEYFSCTRGMASLETFIYFNDKQFYVNRTTSLSIKKSARVPLNILDLPSTTYHREIPQDTIFYDQLTPKKKTRTLLIRLVVCRDPLHNQSTQRVSTSLPRLLYTRVSSFFTFFAVSFRPRARYYIKLLICLGALRARLCIKKVLILKAIFLDMYTRNMYNI